MKSLSLKRFRIIFTVVYDSLYGRERNVNIPGRVCDCLSGRGNGYTGLRPEAIWTLNTIYRGQRYEYLI